MRLVVDTVQFPNRIPVAPAVSEVMAERDDIACIVDFDIDQGARLQKFECLCFLEARCCAASLVVIVADIGVSRRTMAMLRIGQLLLRFPIGFDDMRFDFSRLSVGRSEYGLVKKGLLYFLFLGCSLLMQSRKFPPTF